MKTLCNVTYGLCIYTTSRFARLAYKAWTLLCLVAFLAFYIWFLGSQKEHANSFLFVATMILTILDFAFIGASSFEGYYALKNINEPELLLTVITWIQCVYSGLSIYIFVVLLLQGDQIAWIFISAIYLAAIVLSINITLWLVAMPCLMVFSILECILRTTICRLQCPYMKRKCKTYDYQLYKYNQTTMKETKQCMICLANFTSTDTELCVILCQVSHVFHEKCLFEWVKKQDYCPVCRGEIKFSLS